MTNMLPCSAGVCLKANHYEEALKPAQIPTWFEVHAENYMGDGGPAHSFLDQIRANAPLSIHGVGMSIGSAEGLESDHLNRLCRVVKRFEPAMVSEHLAWSIHHGQFFNDLLPLPYDDETLDRVCGHVDQIQTRLGRQILLENPSTYLGFEGNDYTEQEFLTEISRRSGCLLLLDINNAFVSARNQGYSCEDYLDRFPLTRVAEIHLAGHEMETDEHNNVLFIDTHDRAVCDAVWNLYSYTLEQSGPLPTLIEWDTRIPTWPVLVQQAELANQRIMHSYSRSPHAITG